MCIKNKLQYICETNGLKLKDFQEITGLPYRTAQSYLNGTRTPNADGLAEICTRLRVNMNWLLADIGKPFIEETATINTSLSSDEQEILQLFRSATDTDREMILHVARRAEKKATISETHQVA